MSRKILLADDSLTIQKVVELTFAETDYEVIAVSSGDELLGRLAESQPDIVICDVIMPGRDGYDVCQEIKSSPETLHLPVILLTGTFEPFDRDRALAAGCSEIITKPFEARKLVETVEQLSTTGGAPPPATPFDEEDDMEADGQVTPPPPIAAPEMTFGSESDGEIPESDVRHEFDDEDTVTDGADAEPLESDFFADETPAFEATAQSIATEFDSEAQDEEDDFELPDVEDPPDTDAFRERPPEDLNTVASDSWIDVTDGEPGEQFADEHVPEEIEDPFSPETEEQPPEGRGDEPFGFESVDEDRAQPDGPDVDEPASDEESARTMTTPIDVAAVMAHAEAEEEPTTGDEGFESIEVDPSDADTQDVTEEAAEAEKSIAVETPVEPYEPEAPVEPIDFESPSDPFETETPMESIEFEDPAQTISIETPSDPFEAQSPEQSFEVEAPMESVAVEPPTDTFEAGPPMESFELDAPEESIAVEPPSDPFEAEAPADSFELEVSEEPVAVETPSDPFEAEPAVKSVEVEAPAEPVAAAPPAKPAEVEAASLSDDDVDRIARRLLDLASDRIEHIAWEIIPDMAEIVIRERVRDLEADSDN